MQSNTVIERYGVKLAKRRSSVTSTDSSDEDDT